MTKVAILLPVFDDLDYTRNTLGNLSSAIHNSQEINRNCKFEIVVVDDGSTDGTSEWIKKHAPEVHLLHGDGSLWWSGSVNRAATHAIQNLNCEYLLLWNNDIIIRPDYFSVLCNHLKNISPKIILGSKVYVAGKENTLWSVGGYFNPYTGVKYPIGFGAKDSEKYSRPLDVDWLPGMGTCLHRSVIENIGLWDEKRFPQYHGDSDFTCRARENGYILRVFPDLALWNHVEHTGVLHNYRWKDLWKSFTSIKSNYHLRKDLMFYRTYGKGVWCYTGLFIKYFRYIGGFLKGKFSESVRKVARPFK